MKEKGGVAGVFQGITRHAMPGQLDPWGNAVEAGKAAAVLNLAC